ncbi:MAG: chromosomal replication initiator protein DnaA, partial [Spirochaetota bacterium]|nr:chromosomal replication initiator protein DnaA [Spirochaetota bacterium]
MYEKEWQLIDKYLKRLYPEDQELWLDYIKFLSSSETEIFISVPNEIYKEKIVNKYLPYITKFINDKLSKNINIRVMIENNDETEDNIIILPKKSPGNKPISSNKTHDNFYSLEVKHTFEQFVVGNNSQLAHAAAIRISENPGKEYNPFFLYGGVGLGKTHLMQAIGHEITHKEPGMEVLYLTSEQFTNEYVNSLQRNRVHAFRLKYRYADVLLIDDIQFLERKEGIQEELFHTFNMLKESGKQMVFTSDRSPRELKTITDRLISRFASGLVADIKPPDFETRKAILKMKSIKNNILLSEDITDFLANNITNNVRDLEASVIKLKSVKDLLKEELTLKRVEEELIDIINYNYLSKNISVERIQKEV